MTEQKKTSNFRKPRSFAPKSSVVYIGNLPYDVGEKDLEGLFGKFGRVRRVNLITDPGSDKSKGIAFITMLKQNDAKRAIKAYDGRVIKGRTIKCSEALERADAPRNAKKSAQRNKPLKVKMDKQEISMIKKERRKSSLDKMFENIGR